MRNLIATLVAIGATALATESAVAQLAEKKQASANALDTISQSSIGFTFGEAIETGCDITLARPSAATATTE